MKNDFGTTSTNCPNRAYLKDVDVVVLDWEHAESPLEIVLIGHLILVKKVNRDTILNVLKLA